MSNQPPDVPNQPGQPNPTPPASKQLRVEIPNNLNAIYANGALVSQTHSEIIIDFMQILPNTPTGRVQTRIAMTPANAKLFLQALQQNLDRFEAKQGPITLPPTPPSLADQLFRSLKPEDEE